MNTATVDILAANGKAYGPARVGSGRVIADAAISTPAYAYATKDPSLVSVVFGVIEVDKKKYKDTKSITVVNKSKKTQTYKVKYVPATTIPGAGYTLDRGTVTLKAGASTRVNVTLDVDAGKYAKTIDPTMDRVQQGLPRAWVADVSGRVELTSSTAPTLRVPVHAAPKLVADMEAKKIKFAKGATSGTVDLKGDDIRAGSGDTQVVSLVSAFQYGASSARLPRSADEVPGARSMDLQHVGAASTARTTGMADGLLNFGVSTWDNWAHLAGGTEIDIEIDTNGDGMADFLTFNANIGEIDADLAATFNARTGEQVDLQFINGLGGDVDTNTFDTNVASLPVSLAALGLTSSSGPISYRVSTYSQYNTDESGTNVPVDTTKWIKFNAVAPELSFAGAGTVFADLDKSTLKAKVASTSTQAKALFLHLHNASGDRAQVVDVEVRK